MGDRMTDEIEQAWKRFNGGILTNITLIGISGMAGPEETEEEIWKGLWKSKVGPTLPFDSIKRQEWTMKCAGVYPTFFLLNNADGTVLNTWSGFHPAMQALLVQRGSAADRVCRFFEENDVNHKFLRAGGAREVVVASNHKQKEYAFRFKMNSPQDFVKYHEDVYYKLSSTGLTREQIGRMQISYTFKDKCGRSLGVDEWTDDDFPLTVVVVAECVDSDDDDDDASRSRSPRSRLMMRFFSQRMTRPDIWSRRFGFR